MSGAIRGHRSRIGIACDRYLRAGHNRAAAIGNDALQAALGPGQFLCREAHWQASRDREGHEHEQATHLENVIVNP
jgi:hypothetical protein